MSGGHHFKDFLGEDADRLLMYIASFPDHPKARYIPRVREVWERDYYGLRLIMHSACTC